MKSAIQGLSLHSMMGEPERQSHQRQHFMAPAALRKLHQTIIRPFLLRTPFRPQLLSGLQIAFLPSLLPAPSVLPAYQSPSRIDFP